MSIRKIRTGDAEGFLLLRQQLEVETNFLLLEPGERNTTVKEVIAQIQAANGQGNQMIWVVEDEGNLIGYLAVSGGKFHRNRHCAYITIGLKQAFTGQGIGTRLFNSLESWAKQEGIHRLELTVMMLNAAAIGLYKKMGFSIEGVKNDSLLIDGHYVNEYMMAKLV